jgi:hypothetical protein
MQSVGGRRRDKVNAPTLDTRLEVTPRIGEAGSGLSQMRKDDLELAKIRETEVGLARVRKEIFAKGTYSWVGP